MRKPIPFVVGVIVVLAGIVFSLQGFGVITGSAMSNSGFWKVGGPVVVIVGLVLVLIGMRGRLPRS